MGPLAGRKAALYLREPTLREIEQPRLLLHQGRVEEMWRHEVEKAPNF